MRWLLALFMTFCLTAVWAQDKSAPPPTISVKGTVLEVKDVSSYTYLRLKTKDGEMWAAVSRAPVKKGADVTIENAMIMTSFHSAALNRTFDKILLGTLAGANPHAAYAGGDMGSVHAGVPVPGYTGNVKVAKARGPNAHTVAEIITRRAALKDKIVLVRGTVVRYTPDVLKTNWLHVRDGSGSAAEHTDDLVVCTTDHAKVGDVVLVKGVVHTDKNLGSGYAYRVLIENAKLQK